MSARVRALVSVERPVVIIVDDAVSPSEEYVELEFETQEDANAAAEPLNEILKKAKAIAFKRRDRGEAHLEG
jgi:hypothetical protein